MITDNATATQIAWSFRALSMPASPALTGAAVRGGAGSTLSGYVAIPCQQAVLTADDARGGFAAKQQTHGGKGAFKVDDPAMRRVHTLLVDPGLPPRGGAVC